jgi:L-rhamnonate dehydratase
MFPRIAAVRAYLPTGDVKGDYHSQPGGHWIADSAIATPMSHYPEYRARRTSWGINALGGFVVEVESTDGNRGYGVSQGGRPACEIVVRHLDRFVVGSDPRDVERIWDQMWRATAHYGRKGLAMHAISAIDLAIWDLLGRIRGEPVYKMLGGETKESIPAYATGPLPVLYRDLGFAAAKFPLMHAPIDGRAGFEANVADVAAVREAVGPSFDIAVDCYMSLSVPYAIEMARSIEPYRVRWLEECLVPEDYEGHSELRQNIRSTMLATGEHEYGRFGFNELLTRRCVDILQPDVTWVGGLTEARRIVALAAARDVAVVPHGSGVFGHHLVAAFVNCPMIEHLMLSPKGDQVVPTWGALFTGETVPDAGVVRMPDTPGFGIEPVAGALEPAFT